MKTDLVRLLAVLAAGLPAIPETMAATDRPAPQPPAATPATAGAAAPAASAPAAAEVAAGNNAFACDLYREIKAAAGQGGAEQTADGAGGGNVFFSPYSVAVALTMAAEGARGATAAEMGQVLRFPASLRRADDPSRPWDMAGLHASLAALSDALTGTDEEREAKAGPVRARIAKLRQDLAAAQVKAKEAEAAPGFDRRQAAAQEADDAAAKLNAALAQIDQFELKIANAVWGEKTYPFAAAYVATIARHYRTGGVFPADFIDAFPAERGRINAWVAERTGDRIRDIIPELAPAQAKLLRLVLTNAIYFKGRWAAPFAAAATGPRDFHRAGGGVIRTAMMRAEELEGAKYAAFNADGSFFATPRQAAVGREDGLYPGPGGFAMVELPYKGGTLAMVVIAPNSPDGLGALERELTAERLGAWLGRLAARKVHVELPKFKLETKYELGEQLRGLGMRRAFVDPALADGADFGGMSASRRMEDQLYISHVLHKAFVEVNEEGTEAAAATAVLMVRATAMPAMSPFTPRFQADRPFLFLIRDRVSGAILFLGRMTEPQP